MENSNFISLYNYFLVNRVILDSTYVIQNMYENFTVNASVFNNIWQNDSQRLQILGHEHLSENVVPLGEHPLDGAYVILAEHVLEHSLDHLGSVESNGFLDRRALKVERETRVSQLTFAAAAAVAAADVRAVVDQILGDGVEAIFYAHTQRRVTAHALIRLGRATAAARGIAEQT